VGIRPRASAVLEISPIQFQRQALDAGRILYFGRVQAVRKAALPKGKAALVQGYG
jgi:hypothetical protein